MSKKKIETEVYRTKIIPLIEKKFENLDIIKEWKPFSIPDQYSPKVDIAIQPFDLKHDENKQVHLLDNEEIFTFLKKAYKYHYKNLEKINSKQKINPNIKVIARKNSNAKCFISIEIENKNSRKHKMGSLINASLLGKFGIAVALSPEAMNTLIRVFPYLKLLQEGKFDISNLIILNKSQFKKLLES